MELLRAWLPNFAVSKAPAADVEKVGETSLDWERWRAASEALERLSELKTKFPLELGSRRFL